MEDIHKKALRKALMERFLRAETSPKEEQTLRVLYLQLQGTLSEEEEEFRTLLLAAALPPRFPPLSEEKAKEFNRLARSQSWRVVLRRIGWTLSAAAAVLTAVWWLLQPTEEIATPVSLASVSPASSVSAPPPTGALEETASVSTSSASAPSPASSSHGHPAVVSRKKQKTKSREQNAEAIADSQTKVPSIGETMQRVRELESMTGKQMETCDLRVVGDAIIVSTQHSDDTSSAQLVTCITEGDGTAIFFFNTTETEYFTNPLY